MSSVSPTPGEQLGLLASVTQAFASSLELEETLRNAVGQITHFMHAEAASLFLLDEAGEQLECRACAGPVNIVGLRLPAGQGVVGRSLRENAVQLLRDARDDPDFAGFVDQKTGFRTRSILCAPLVIKGRRIGALEVLNKVSADGRFDSSDRHLLQAVAASAALVIHNARMAAALVEQERLRRELELARQIQASLLPAARAPPFPLVGVNLPALEVSGDFFDYFDLGGGRIGFALGDVAGKGMNAALLMARASSLLHCLGKDLDDPGLLLARVNQELCESATLGMFVTVVAGVYERASGRIRFANAGHTAPLYRAPQGGFTQFPAAAPPLGILPAMVFPTQQLSLDGGSLYLFSDGVSEGLAGRGGGADIAGVVPLIESLSVLEPARRLERIIAAVCPGGRAPADDVTVLILEDHRGAPGAPA